MFNFDCLSEVLGWCDIVTICKILSTCKTAQKLSKRGSAFKHFYDMLGIPIPFRYSIIRQVVAALLTRNVHAIYFNTLFARVLVVYADGTIETSRGHVFCKYNKFRDSCIDSEGDLLVCTTTATYSTVDVNIVGAAAGRIGFNRKTSQLVSVGFDKVLRRSWELNGFYVSHQPGPVVHMRNMDGHMIVLTNGGIVAQVDSYIAVIMGTTCIHTQNASICWIIGPFDNSTFLIGTNDCNVTLYSSNGKRLSTLKWPIGTLALRRPVVLGHCAISGFSVLHIPTMSIRSLV